MNPGLQPPGDAIFLVKCVDFKCLAVRSADDKWKNYCDDTELPDVAEVIVPVPYELILPFLPDAKHPLAMPGSRAGGVEARP